MLLFRFAAIVAHTLHSLTVCVCVVHLEAFVFISVYLFVSVAERKCVHTNSHAHAQHCTSIAFDFNALALKSNRRIQPTTFNEKKKIIICGYIFALSLLIIGFQVTTFKIQGERKLAVQTSEQSTYER